MRKFILGFLTTFTFIAWATIAQAQEWRLQTEDDVFSGKKTAIVIGGIGKQMTVYLTCDTDRAVTFAVILKEDPDNFPLLSATAIVKIGSGAVRRIEVKGYKHNDDYGGFASAANDPQALMAIKEIGEARDKILVGVQVTGTDVKVSMSYRNSGSTKAVDGLLDACEE